MWKECTVCDSYLISSYGDVKHKITNKILKQKLDKDNYLSVNISMGGRNNTRYFLVHRLVAEAFISNPENKRYVIHLDGNPTNNEVSNLEWTNTRKKSFQARGDSATNSKLLNEQVQYCRDMYKPGDKKYGCTALAELFGVSKSTMSYILNHNTYTAE